MKEWQLRVIREKADLDIKIIKLDRFLESEHVGQLLVSDVDLLGEQLGAMKGYSEILGTRIERFFGKED